MLEKVGCSGNWIDIDKVSCAYTREYENRDGVVVRILQVVVDGQWMDYVDGDRDIVVERLTMKLDGVTLV